MVLKFATVFNHMHWPPVSPRRYP